MKNYNEMADEVFRRRDEYLAARKKKRKTMLAAAASFCCLAALLGAGIWNFRFRTEPPAANDIITPSVTADGAIPTITERTGGSGRLPEETDVRYSYISKDWAVYESVDALTEAGDSILLGKVTGISFQVLDMTTAQPPTEDSAAENCILNTIYEMEVLTSYKGNVSGTLQVRVSGGQKDIYVEEQLAALGEYADEGIPLIADMPFIEVGKTYLFLLCQYKDAMPTLVNAGQGVFDIDDPLGKEPYSGASLKDIISFFGEDKWAEFEAGDFLLE